jgi:hypothetical protein
MPAGVATESNYSWQFLGARHARRRDTEIPAQAIEDAERLGRQGNLVVKAGVREDGRGATTQP